MSEDVLQFGAVGVSMIVMYYLARAIYELVRKRAGLNGRPHLMVSSEWALALDAHTKAMRENVVQMEQVLREDRNERAEQRNRHVRALLDVYHKQELSFAKFDAILASGLLRSQERKP